MEDLEDLARSSRDVDTAAGPSSSSRGVGSSGAAAGIVRFSRRSAAAAADNTSTPTPSSSASFRLDSSGLGGSSTATPKIWLRTFGCAHNVADSETMAGVLKEAGFDVKVAEGGDGDEKSFSSVSSSSSASSSAAADAWVINSCTVKGPSQAAVEKLVAQAKALGKPVVVAGCVPQGEPRSKTLEGASLLGVRQLDRVADVVSEALKGNVVSLTSVAREIPSLELPRVRRNAHVEIVPLSTG